MPVLRSGSFVLYGFQLTDHGALIDGDTQYSGDPGTAGTWSWQNFNTTQIISFPTDVTFTGPTTLDTTTEGNGWTAGAPPPGFTLKTAPIFTGPTLHSVLTGCAGFGLLGTVRGAGMFNQCGNVAYTNADPLLLYIELLDFYQMHLTNTVGLTSGGISKTGPWSTPSAGIRITGGYDIVAWWWVRKNPCQAFTRVSKLTLSTENPDVEDNWEKLDPNDSDAAPTPVIDDVTPNHGPIAGGTEITVTGSGFGTDFDLQVDGVSCTDLVYVSQYEVRGKVPSHIAGAATVVLINADGVSS
jgi:hypothetical protein